jgi:hypothetical protein
VLSSPFFWVFVAVATTVDIVGLFYLWRRRNSPPSGNHKVILTTGQRGVSLAERRRKERRVSKRVASA